MLRHTFITGFVFLLFNCGAIAEGGSKIDSLYALLPHQKGYEKVKTIRFINRILYYANYIDSIAANLKQIEPEVVKDDDNSNVLIQFDWGLYYAASGRVNTALEHYTKIFALNPTDKYAKQIKATAYLNTAIAFSDMRQLNAAMDMCNEAIIFCKNEKLDTDGKDLSYVSAWSLKGNLYFKLFQQEKNTASPKAAGYFSQYLEAYNVLLEYYQADTKKDNPSGVYLEIYASMAGSLYHKSDNSFALQLFKKLQIAAIQQKDVNGYIRVQEQYILATFFSAENKRYILSIANETIAQLQLLPNKYNTIYLFQFYKAGCYDSLHIKDSAAYWYQQSLQPALQNNQFDIALQCLHYLGTYYENRNAGKSIEYKNKEIELKSTIIINQTSEDKIQKETLNSIEQVRTERRVTAEKEKTLRNRNLLILSVAALLILASILAAAMLNIRSIRNKKLALQNEILYQKEKTLNNELGEITALKIQLENKKAIAANSQKIARNLHDDLASSLAALYHFTEDKAARSFTPQDKINFESLREETKSIYNNTRNYIHSLAKNEETISYSLSNYLFQLIIGNTRAYKVKFEVQADYENLDEKLSLEQQSQLYHIIKEAVANSLKHAQATLISIAISVVSKQCFFTIKDNGLGLQTKSEAGMGLQNMRDRLESIGGTLQINDDQGTVISGNFIL